MSWIYDEGTEGSCFVWTIQNFSYCLHKPEDYLDSPSLVLKDNVTDTYRFRLYPRGPRESASTDFKTIGFRLCINNYPTSPFSTEFALSIQTASGSYIKLGDSISDYRSYLVDGQRKFLKLEDLGRKDGGILVNDCLTLRCRLWKLNSRQLPPLQCQMRTIINVERTTGTWSLDKLRQNTSSNKLTTILPLSFKMQYLIAGKLLSCRESFSGDSITVEIKHIGKHKQCFATCDLLVFEYRGEVVHSVREEHMFDASQVSQVWTFQYAPPSKICDFKNTYFSCELAVSAGIENSWVESFEIEETDTLPSSNLKNEQQFADSWKDDLERFYSKGKFTDVIVHTQSKSFWVHKAILCARSNVFHAMFEQDMKVNRTSARHIMKIDTGVIHKDREVNRTVAVYINDIDADTVHKMFLFVYSDVVEDLDFDAANKLYSAADKYRITALKRRCADFLKENLSVSNVCEVLVLANVHRDEELKSFVVDFIVEHAAEVMRSAEWETVMQDQASLAAKIMHRLLLQKS